MTNDEEILKRLDALATTVDGLTTSVAALTTNVTGLAATVAELPTRAEIPTVEQIREVVKEEVQSEVASQLESKFTQRLAPIHEKLDEIRGDGDSYARTDAYHDRRLKRLEKQLDLYPLPTQ